MRKRTFLDVSPTKPQISLRMRAVWFEVTLGARRHFASLAIQNARIEDSEHTVLFRLCECADWSESLLSVHIRRYVSCRYGSFTTRSTRFRTDCHNFRMRTSIFGKYCESWTWRIISVVTSLIVIELLQLCDINCSWNLTKEGQHLFCC